LILDKSETFAVLLIVIVVGFARAEAKEVVVAGSRMGSYA
jgi:hypothetical protein|tara:strand:- start:1077 stop:1196 length:120 start_codon:yes stop_codon:yes gene_type:complete